MEEQWLTYAEAASRLGIKIDSVKRRARSRRWPRRKSNGGLVQVAIPADALPDALLDILEDRRSDALPDNPPSIRADNPPPSAYEASAQRARADALAEQVADLRAERDRLLTIIESQSRPIDARPGFLDRIERFFRR